MAPDAAGDVLRGPGGAPTEQSLAADAALAMPQHTRASKKGPSAQLQVPLPVSAWIPTLQPPPTDAVAGSGLVVRTFVDDPQGLLPGLIPPPLQQLLGLDTTGGEGLGCVLGI